MQGWPKIYEEAKFFPEPIKWPVIGGKKKKPNKATPNQLKQDSVNTATFFKINRTFLYKINFREVQIKYNVFIESHGGTKPWRYASMRGSPQNRNEALRYLQNIRPFSVQVVQLLDDVHCFLCLENGHISSQCKSCSYCSSSDHYFVHCRYNPHYVPPEDVIPKANPNTMAKSGGKTNHELRILRKQIRFAVMPCAREIAYYNMDIEACKKRKYLVNNTFAMNVGKCETGDAFNAVEVVIEGFFYQIHVDLAYKAIIDQSKICKSAPSEHLSISVSEMKAHGKPLSQVKQEVLQLLGAQKSVVFTHSGAADFISLGITNWELEMAGIKLVDLAELRINGFTHLGPKNEKLKLRDLYFCYHKQGFSRGNTRAIYKLGRDVFLFWQENKRLKTYEEMTEKINRAKARGVLKVHDIKNMLNIK
ncbi:hypothetical protein B4U79_16428 [Dinothrombium tinctorium]|uniref:CCHC-type domain-containing protein n=1 Tax=Dinothrombium tinctorium TaxID=1965070 RepID=A0A443QMM4_9ACAR|nr:hypothetical protein B4U79_16428 [Dinothrombium tinctorium]